MSAEYTIIDHRANTMTAADIYWENLSIKLIICRVYLLHV